jgi:hypothetical protein
MRRPLHFIHKIALTSTLLVAATLAPRPAHARIYFSFDLDSLAFYGTDIVEAELVATPDGKIPLYQARVTKVLSGNLKENQTVAIGTLAEYAKPLQGPFQTTPLASGDHAILFLARGPYPFAGRNHDDQRLNLLPGGIRLITDKGVAAFDQYINPGPAVAEISRDGQAPLPTLEEFRTTLAESLRRAVEIRPKLQAALAARDGAALLALLKIRATSQTNDRQGGDMIAYKLDECLADLADPGLTDEAATIQGLHGQSSLRYSFSTLRGHGYLLARLADRKLPAEQRVRYAQLIAYASPQLLARAEAPTPPAAASAPDNTYVRKLAAMVADPATEPAVRDTILQSFNWYIDRPTAEITADFRAAAEVLRKFHAQTSDEPLLFALERAIHAFDPAAYTTLHSRCGPILSLITPLKTPDHQPTSKDAVVVPFHFDYQNYLDPRSADTLQIKIILQPAKPGKSFELTSLWHILPPRVSNSSIASSDQIELPPNLPHARYRVFARFILDGNSVGESYGFQADL